MHPVRLAVAGAWSHLNKAESRRCNADKSRMTPSVPPLSYPARPDPIKLRPMPTATATEQASFMYSIETGGQLEPHLRQEWLLTNGLGGFSMGTVVGCNTRRYHGLLVAATLPPVGRVMALNRLGEVLSVDGGARTLEFSVNQFAHDLFPR